MLSQPEKEQNFKHKQESGALTVFAAWLFLKIIHVQICDKSNQ